MSVITTSLIISGHRTFSALGPLRFLHTVGGDPSPFKILLANILRMFHSIPKPTSSVFIFHFLEPFTDFVSFNEFSVWPSGKYLDTFLWALNESWLNTTRSCKSGEWTHNWVLRLYKMTSQVKHQLILKWLYEVCTPFPPAKIRTRIPHALGQYSWGDPVHWLFTYNLKLE